MPRRGDGESSEQLRIWLLGGFRATVGSREVESSEWRLRKARSLVKLLALAPSRRLHREQLLEVLWPDLEPEAASNNLRKALHVARRALVSAAAAPITPYLQLKDEVLSLAPDGGLWVDVEAFELAGAEARRRRDVEAYRAALDLYAGDLLPEDRYEDWTISRREALRQEYLSLLAELAALHERAGAFAPAAEVLQTLLTHDPGREEAHRSLMRLYALTGRRQQALRQYQMLREAAGREFDAEPDAESQRLYQEIASGRFPPPGTGEVALAPASATPAPTLPAGTVTFLFTDIEGSTQLLADLGDRYADILAAHHRLLRAAFERWGGQ